MPAIIDLVRDVLPSQLSLRKDCRIRITKIAVAARLKDINADREAADERKLLEEYLGLIDEEATASGKAKAAAEALMGKVATKYGKLSEDEIKTLVVEDKWLA